MIDPTQPGPTYPGGETRTAYRWAFKVYATLFLLTLCVGLLNFLGAFLKARFGN